MNAKTLTYLIAAVVFAACTITLSAQTINVPQTSTIGNWGPGSGGQQAYAQTITAPSSVTLSSFTFTSLQSLNGSFNYQTEIYAFNPGAAQAVGAVLYTSPLETVTTTAASSTITPHLTLTSGTSYIIFVTPLVSSQINGGGFGLIGSNSSGSYSGGTFYFAETNGSTNVDGYSWFGGGFDNTAFTLVFAPAGLPGFNRSLTPNQYNIGEPINAGIAAGNSGAKFTSLVNALEAQPSLGAALDQLSPQAFGQFTSSTAFNNASFETEAMDNYLAGQRTGPNGTFAGGNGTIDASGLTLNDPSYDPNLAMVHSRLLAWNPAPYGAISDSTSSVLGGVEMKDSKDTKSMNPVAAYANPWNFYARGNVILGQGFSGTDVSHFDDNTESVALGTDYRITRNFLVGLTAGYAHTDVTLDNNGSSATVDSYSPGFYASYADKGWFANLSGDYLHNAYTQSRVIGFLGQTANSAPEGNEGVANLDGGYEFHQGALTYGPIAGIQYTHLAVDGYTENGSDADLNVNEQNADSLRSRLGGRVSYQFSHYGLTFAPHLDASWQHEFMDQSRGITSQFDGAGLGSFSVETTNPSRDSALADVGMNVEINRTVTAFVDYQVQAGQENYFGQSVQGGVKIGF